MRPEERESLLASYALGILSAPDMEDAERLVHSDPSAAAEVEQYREIGELLAFSAPLHRPPVALRERVLSAARRSGSVPRRRRWRVPVARFMPAAVLAAALAIVTVWAVNLQHQMQDLRDDTAVLSAIVEADAKRLDQVAAAEATRGEVSVRLETQLQDQAVATSILSDPVAVKLELAPTSAAHGASGSFAWSSAVDSAVVNLQGLSPLPIGGQYRAAVSDRWGNLISVEAVVVDANGAAMEVFATPPGLRPYSVAIVATQANDTNGFPEGPIILQASGN